MFYSVDWVAAGVRWVIEHNPVYLYIYILRQCVVYGQRPEWMYVRNGIIWAAGMFGIRIYISRIPLKNKPNGYSIRNTCRKNQ